MARGKKHTPEQRVSLLRQIEVAVANGKTTPAACREGGITEQTYYRWRKKYGALQVDQAQRLKELEQKNAKLEKWKAKNASHFPTPPTTATGRVSIPLRYTNYPTGTKDRAGQRLALETGRAHCIHAGHQCPAMQDW
jgi:hypothetical protein